MTITVKGPDGSTFNFPDHTSPGEIQNVMGQHYGKGGAGHGQIAGEPDLGALGNSLLAGGIHFVHQLPLVGDAAITAGRVAHQAMNGQPLDWQAANDEAHQIIKSASDEHPVASTVGGIAGGADAALIGGGALKAAGVAAPAALSLKAGQPLLNVGRLAAMGAGAGAAQGGAQGGGEQLAGGHIAEAPGAAAQGALVGGTVGAVTGGVIGGGTGVAQAARRLLPGKTALALSKVFGEKAADLQAAWTQFQDSTGRPPSMAELATLKQRGAITEAAKGSPAITDALAARADTVDALRSRNMQAAVSPGPDPASSGEMANARTAQGDVDYAASRAAPDFHISTDETDDLGGVSPADHLSAEILPQAGLGRADRVRIQTALLDGRLSSQDAQLIRSGLNDSLNRNYSPALRGYVSDLDSFLGGPGNEAPNAALDTATSNFAANSRREEGASHGERILGSDTPENFAATAASKANANPEFAGAMPGGAGTVLARAASTPQGATSLAQRLATDDSLHAKMATALGPDAADALREMGAQETQSAENLAPFKNKTPPSDDLTASASKRVFQGLLASVSHGPFAVYHAVKALGIQGLSPSVQEKVAQYLSDPRMVSQGINLLRKAGATSEQLRQLAFSAAQHAGATTGGVASGSASQ